MEYFIGKGVMPSQIPCGSTIKLHIYIMALFCCSCLSFFKVFEVGSPISIPWSFFSLLSVLLTSRDSRYFPVFSPTSLYLRNLIIIVRTTSDGLSCSTLPRYPVIFNRVRKRMNSNCNRRTGTSTQQTASSKY